jgi:hypothetical protein
VEESHVMKVGSARRIPLAVVVAAVAFAGTASAHGTAIETPPIPIPVLLASAAVAVAGTAVALAVGPRPPTDRVRLGAMDARTATAGRTLVRALAVVALAAAAYSGVTSRVAVTVAELVVWPVLFKGSLLVAAAVGSPWRLVAPWWLAYDAICALEGDTVQFREYPAWLGRWPAVLGVALVVGVVENLTVVPNSGRLTVVFLTAYAVAMVVGALAFGREFLERADAFTVLYDLAGRVAPVRFERDGDRVLAFARPPWVGCMRPLADVPTAAFVVVAVATVTFDGWVETTAAARALAALAPAAGAYAGLVLYAGFLAAFLAGAVVVRRAVEAAAGSRSGGDQVRADGTGLDAAEDAVSTAREASRTLVALAATLLPIAVAYDVAHNYSYVLVNATRLLSRAFEAVGLPLSLSAEAALAPVAVWTTQVALVVGGHLVAVVAAHIATERRFPDARAARRGHAPLAALMVAYTVVSLYVLAAP